MNICQCEHLLTSYPHSPSPSLVFKTIHQGIAVSFTVHYDKVSQEQCKMLLVWKHRAEWHKLALQGSAHTPTTRLTQDPIHHHSWNSWFTHDAILHPICIFCTHWINVLHKICLFHISLIYIYILMHIHAIIAQLVFILQICHTYSDTLRCGLFCTPPQCNCPLSSNQSRVKQVTP